MPNKTIYVRDADLPLFEQAQDQLGTSVSALFSEFLNDRMARLNPEESRILNTIEQIGRRRESTNEDRRIPRFVDGVYAEASAHAEGALKHLRARRVRDAKASFWVANAYSELAERIVKEVVELNGKLAAMSKS